MGLLNAVPVVAIVFAIGYGGLYEAEDDRDPDREVEVAGVAVRFVSLMAVAFGSIFSVVGAATADPVF